MRVSLVENMRFTECLQFTQSLFTNKPGLTLLEIDGKEWLQTYQGPKFDLIFADTWPGKYEDLEEVLGLLNQGGIYFIDDMLPHPNWPEGHAEKAERLIQHLEERPDLLVTTMNWSTGVIIGTKI